MFKKKPKREGYILFDDEVDATVETDRQATEEVLSKMETQFGTSKYISVQRPALSQEEFDREFGARHVNLDIAYRIRAYFKTLGLYSCHSWVTTFFPPSQWLREYSIKRDFVQDTLSGLTVGIMNIPQGMAYGMLTGLPAVHGLYTSFFLPMLYALFGTSRQMSFGTFAVISLMVSTVINDVAPPVPREMLNGTMNESIAEVVTDTGGDVLSWFCGVRSVDGVLNPRAVDAAITLSFLVGICQFCFGLLHMGFVSVYLSDQLVEGLTTGAAFLVFTSQASQLLDIRGLPQATGVLGVLKFYVCLFSKITTINWAATIASTICIIILAIAKHFEPKFRLKFKFPLPVELFLIIISTLLSHFVHLESNYGMKVVGAIPTGLQTPRLPSVDLMPRIFPAAISASIVIFSLGISMGKVFAKKHDYEINPNQEWFAYGISHFISSFFGCHCGGTSLSRSVVQDQQGGKTQIAGMIAALLILIVLLALAPAFQSLPTCVLASIIVVNLKGLLFQLRRLPALWQNSKTDCMIWIVAFIAVVLMDISYGLIIAVFFALLTVLFRSQWPHSICLGRVAGTEVYKAVDGYIQAKEIPGVKIYRFDSPLYFANADVFREELNLHTGINVVEEKRKIVAQDKHDNADQENAMLQCVNGERLRAIIVDCSSFSYVDMMGLDALRQVYDDYNLLKIQLAFASAKVAVRQMMQSTGFFERVPRHVFYPTLPDAVSCILSTPSFDRNTSDASVCQL